MKERKIKQIGEIGSPRWERRKELLSRAWKIVEQAVELGVWNNATGFNFVEGVRKSGLEEAEEWIIGWENEIRGLIKKEA